MVGIRLAAVILVWWIAWGFVLRLISARSLHIIAVAVFIPLGIRAHGSVSVVLRSALGTLGRHPLREALREGIHTL